MRWQDLVLMLSSFLFSVALLPALRSPAKPPYSACVMTASLIAVNTVIFSTLHLWLATLSTAVNGIVWAVLAWQGRKTDSQPKAEQFYLD